MNNSKWTMIGDVNDLITSLKSSNGLQEIVLAEKKLALSYINGEFGLISNVCNHMGGPLHRGHIKGDHLECPWHYWKFHHQTGRALDDSAAPIASAAGSIPSYLLKIEDGHLYADISSATQREKPTYNPRMHVARPVVREPGKIRVLGISTTAMDKDHPRYSTSAQLLQSTLSKAEKELGVESKTYHLHEMNFRNCEGFYSKSEKACTWPCSITKIDPQDEMVKLYEAFVHWADVIVVATPIRWGSASSLYYKMAERLNAIQNQITLNDNVLIKNKVASFIITGGQDNVQAVAGQMQLFFGELGFVSPAFPFVGHSLGWSSEQMEKNMDYVKNSEKLHQDTFSMLERSVDLAKKLIFSKNESGVQI